MKKNSLFVLLAVFMMCMAVAPVSAMVARSSDQISYFESKVSALIGGDIKITYQVDGNDNMDELGAEEVVIYRKSGSKWIKADSYDRNDPGMTESNSCRCRNTITFDGTSGAEYKVVITVFAEDSSGYDSRTKTHYVTAK